MYGDKGYASDARKRAAEKAGVKWAVRSSLACDASQLSKFLHLRRPPERYLAALIRRITAICIAHVRVCAWRSCSAAISTGSPKISRT